MKDRSNMRVMQVMAGAEFGGAEAFFVRMAIALRRAGLHQRVIIRKNAQRAKALRDGGVEPVELKFGGMLDIWTPLGLKREIESFKPDIVVTWMNRATKMCPKGNFIHVARLGGYYDLKYYQGCNHLVGNTRDIVDYLIGKGWPEDRAHYLPNFVNAEEADPIDRAAIYVPKGKPLLLALGRLHENKGFDILFEALVRIPEAYLMLAGDGPKREELIALAEKLGVRPRIRFLGWRDDAAALFAAADVFICSSRHEPLGNVLVEAWAHSVAVVAADSQGPGALIENEKNGMLVPIDDGEAMATAIKKVLDDDALRAKIAKNGRASYEQNFTEDIVVDAYVSFFKKLIED